MTNISFVSKILSAISNILIFDIAFQSSIIFFPSLMLILTLSDSLSPLKILESIFQKLHFPFLIISLRPSLSIFFNFFHYPNLFFGLSFFFLHTVAFKFLCRKIHFVSPLPIFYAIAFYYNILFIFHVFFLFLLLNVKY